MKSCLCKQIVYGLLSKSKTNGVQQMQFQLRIQSYRSARVWPRSPFFIGTVSLQTLEQARTVVFAICAPSVSDEKSQSLKKRFVLPFQWTQRCCSQRQALGLPWHRSILDSWASRQTWSSSVLLGSDLHSVKSSLCIDLRDAGAGSRGNYRDNGDLGCNSYEQLDIPLSPCSTPSTPRHLNSRRRIRDTCRQAHDQTNNMFQMISHWQVYLNTTRDPHVHLNQPCLIFTSLPFLVYFQTSLPSTLDLFVNPRSWYFQGLNGSCTTLSEGSKTSACGALVWADWSYGDSANNPWCAFILTWPPLWHPLEHHLRPSFHFGFKINEPLAFLVYRFMIIGNAIRHQERINTLLL